MKITEAQIAKFTDANFLIPAMVVTVFLTSAVKSEVYLVPAGFELDKYVNSLYPSFDLKVDAYPTKLIVSAMFNDKPIETHQGVFQYDHEPN